MQESIRSSAADRERASVRETNVSTTGLDAGVVEFVLGAREPLEGHALEYHEMLRYDIVLITSRNHPLAGRETVTPHEAAKWPAIVPPAGSYSRQFGEIAAREFGTDVKAVR